FICGSQFRLTGIAWTAFFQFFNRARPVIFQQTGKRPVGQQLSVGLAAWTVVSLVLGVHDALDERAADGAGLTVPAVNSHALTEGRHLFGKALANLPPEPLRPLEKRLAYGLEQALDLGLGELVGQLERGQAGPMQNLVR